jgi:hypothetical protein
MGLDPGTGVLSREELPDNLLLNSLGTGSAVASLVVIFYVSERAKL